MLTYYKQQCIERFCTQPKPSVQILSIKSAVTNKKEAVTSAQRKYILDLQVNKYGVLKALWQEEPVKKQQAPSLPGSR